MVTTLLEKYPNKIQTNMLTYDTYYNRDVSPHVSKLDPKSLNCIFLSYSRVQKGYRCYCTSLLMYLVSADVTFLEITSFSQDSIHSSQGVDDDLLGYTLASPALAFVPPLTKPPITQVYSRRQNPLLSSPTQVASTLDPISMMIFLLLFVKVKVSVFTQFFHFVLITICHHIPIILVHP